MHLGYECYNFMTYGGLGGGESFGFHKNRNPAVFNNACVLHSMF